LNIPVTQIHGIGPVKAETLKTEAGIETIEDLLYYMPRKYLDRSLIKRIVDCFSDEEVTVAGNIVSVNLIRRKKVFLQVDVSDGTDMISAVFFGAAGFLQKLFNEGDFIILSGKVNILRSKQILHPDFDFIDENSDIKSINTGRIIPLYRSTNSLKKNGFDSRGFRRMIRAALEQFSSRIEETLPDSILSKYNLIQIYDALRGIHFPDSMEHAGNSRVRLAFNEIYFFQYYILLLKKINKKSLPQNRTRTTDVISDFKKTLKFKLTGDQEKSLEEIQKDLNSPYPMNRLLQGDVGSGKTVIALAGALITISRGLQAAMMVPTEILAQQHYETSLRLLPDNIRTILVTGSMTQKEKKLMYDEISSGRADLVIGTHALIQSAVNFKQLGYIIIDEQHRFGVEQRARLWQKNLHPPHILVMTATPIPRTLAMTLYGDLDVSVIDELPPGRMPVKTMHFTDTDRNKVFGFVRNQIKEGRQTYFVYPLIKESESMDYKDLEDGWDTISRVFQPPEYCISIVHGRMTPADKDKSMQLFKEGHAHILVATTVIEVGVDIPNATVMVIESAERFGLSQLHQLRGRVGRGADQSYCILMSSDKLSKEAIKRIEVMVRTNDGFEIAETDLQLRGPGDIEGTQQSGIPFDLKIANLGKDGQIIEYVRHVAEQILEKDPMLSESQNVVLRLELSRLFSQKQSWSSIS